MSTRQKEESLTLEILEAIDQQSDLTQRHLARRMGVALGLANSYLKRCVRKGLVKIQQAPANRYLYYLTPQGFVEKSRLTREYLSYSFAFYRKAGESCVQAFLVCKRENWNRVLLCGVSELAEIASLRALDHGIRIVGIYDPGSKREQFLNLKVFRSLGECQSYDACLLTELNDPQAGLAQLESQLERDRIIVPDILGLRAQI